MDAPAICVLYAQDLDQTMSAVIQRELEAAGGRKGDAADVSRVNIAPNMRLGDRDIHATIVYLDESKFEGSQLGFAASHVRYLLQGRVPELPAWLIQAPPLAEVFVLLAEAWVRCETSPSAAEMAELATAARFFPHRPNVASPVAAVLAQRGRKAEASAILNACAGYAADEKTAASITQLRAKLSAGAGLVRCESESPKPNSPPSLEKK